ncbi:exodeoxyribonuclease VII, small subunit [Parascardovia denticolens DSM 10105 = JCM 12538]|uniref:Exodeoxyribonuclease 7 small subunit n=1 Tax=Parascardovia denticolens DSM 10105 = JCM 12538 TaxID=864564 RepID=E6K058_PARDN|nr:exodeoxyribonuclease VII small subunit [Parascardovia denticolens]EFT84170.1 exodeoxyribonuclease VII, small subunit [Parascardovia denticolens DSM 10105 = JCM 12538]
MIMAKTSAESEETGKRQDVSSSLTEEETKAIASLSYEQARDRLVQVVQTLETGGLDLEDSVHQWELGEALAKRAQTLLDDVRAKLDAAQADQVAAGASAGTQGNMEQA